MRKSRKRRKRGRKRRRKSRKRRRQSRKKSKRRRKSRKQQQEAAGLGLSADYLQANSRLTLGRDIFRGSPDCSVVSTVRTST